jgi:hypothetical protein
MTEASRATHEYANAVEFSVEASKAADAAFAALYGDIGDVGISANDAAAAMAYYGDMVDTANGYIANMVGRTTALATEFANMIDPASIWTKAKGSLKSYHKEITKELAAAKADAASFQKVETWFPDVPPSAWAKIASMPGFAAALCKEGKSAASKDVLAIAEVMAAGGDPAAQAFVDTFGKPVVTAAIAVQTTGLSAAWQGIVKYFAGRHITIDTNLGGYSGKVSGYASGGPMPGPVGRPVPIIAHGGEYMLNAQDVSEIKAALVSGGSGNSSVVDAIERLRGDVRNQVREQIIAYHQGGFAWQH